MKLKQLTAMIGQPDPKDEAFLPTSKPKGAAENTDRLYGLQFAPPLK